VQPAFPFFAESSAPNLELRIVFLSGDTKSTFLPAQIDLQLKISWTPSNDQLAERLVIRKKILSLLYPSFPVSLFPFFRSAFHPTPSLSFPYSCALPLRPLSIFSPLTFPVPQIQLGFRANFTKGNNLSRNIDTTAFSLLNVAILWKSDNDNGINHLPTIN